MGFIKGKTKRVTVKFKIKAKAQTKTEEARQKELERFREDLGKLAEKYNGSETHTK